MQLKIILEVEQDGICAGCHYCTYIVLFSLYPSDGNHSTVLLEVARVIIIFSDTGNKSSLLYILKIKKCLCLFLSWGLTPSIYLS